MRVHVYGIVDSPELAAPMPAGHDDGRLEAIPLGDIAAVVSPAGKAAPEAALARVWHHEKLLGALMEHHAVLPMRFGTICRAEEVAPLLRQRAAALHTALQLVRGRVEMAVRLTPAAPVTAPAGDRAAAASAPPAPGKSYLLALAARQGHPLGDTAPGLREARTRLERLTLKTLWQGPETAGGPVKASCLVARDGIAAFTRDLRAIERPDLQLSCTGPWAPYSFTGEEADLEAAQ